MRQNLLFIFFIFLAIIGCKQKESQKITEFFKENFREKSTYVPTEKLEFDFDSDGLNDTLSIFKIENWNDPGDFQQVQISYANGHTIKMYELGNWINYMDRYSKFKPENLLESENVLYSNFSNDRSFLVVFGYTYASSPGLLTIMDISSETPNFVHKKKFQVMEIEDIDNDGFKEIIGRRFYRETLYDFDTVSYVATYSPYFVLKLKNESFEIDSVLSEKYNYENYVGYYGLKYNTGSRFSVIHPFAKYDAEPYFLFETYRKYPFTSLRKIEETELTNYSKKELRIMRNEIFAFHGYSFKSKDMKEYYESLIWYEPSEDNDLSKMNSIEKFNVELIKKVEEKN